tara:strand:+ start:5725 stop:7311 length:1587 start_codon:yes stop_codon:yes gene_type:complete
MKVLGVNLSHNASIAIVEDGKLLMSLEQERLSKIKKDKNIDKLFEKIKNNYFDIITYTSFNINVAHEKKYENYIKIELERNNIKFNKLILFGYHHLTHAFTAFYNSGFKEAICLIIDNGGLQFKVDNEELGQEVLSIYKINYKKYELLFKLLKSSNGTNKTLKNYHNINCVSPAGVFELYASVFDFKEPGSVMGLSAYGKENSNIYPVYNKDNIFCELNLNFNDLALRHEKDRGGLVTKQDLCYRIQKDTNELVMTYIKKIMQEHKNISICLSGGYFQNSMANYKFLQLSKNIYVDPVCHDGGVSIGLAQHACFIEGKNKPIRFKDLYKGIKYNYSIKEINNLNCKIKNVSNKDVAILLANNKSIAIYQGRSEIGPRALGNRSILYNPADPKAKEKINLIKNREWFRPYAGTILHKYVNDWFDLKGKKEIKFMSYVVEVKKDKINKIPGICHIDNTCRIQTLKKQDNKYFYDLLNEFYKITCIPVILNTSLNLAGKPLVEDIEDVVSFLNNSNIDYVYLPEFNKLLSR